MRWRRNLSESVPNGWHPCVLPDFTCIVMGQSPSSNTYNRSGDGLPFFQGKAEFGEIFPTINRYCSRPKKIAKEGATLLSVRAPVGPTNLAPQECCIGRGLAAIHPCGGIQSKFLLYLLRSIEPVISVKGTGSTFTSITKSFVESLEFKLPPLSEQNRIIAKIEELFSELDKGVESLKTARAQLKVYRQAVLKHAFEGELTAQWREDNKDKVETAEQLRDRITRERSERYERQLKTWSSEVGRWKADGSLGKRPLKPRALKLPDPLTEVELRALPELVRTWCWTRVGQLFSVYVGATPSRKNPDFWNGDISWISSGEVRFRTIEATRETITTEGLKNASTEMHPVGTVMLAMIGEGKTRGQAAITNIEACHNQNTAAIRVSESDISPEYVFYYLLYRYEDTRRIGSGNNQKALNKSRTENLPIPLIPLDEQSIIVQTIDRQLSFIAQSDREIHRQLVHADTLRQSILKKAFSGELVKQDYNEEPASVLLERIKAEKVSQKPKTKTDKRKVAIA